MIIGKHEFLRRGTVNADLPGPWRSSRFTRVNPLAVKLMLYRAKKADGQSYYYDFVCCRGYLCRFRTGST